ncbi:hypothetical protein D3C79_933440 [compost metagenome]
MTASIPLYVLSSDFTTAIPPPPAATTTKPPLINDLIASFSTISIGLGDGTTLRYPLPESSTKLHSGCSFFISSACSLEKKDPTGFVGFLKLGSSELTSTCVITVATFLWIPLTANSLIKAC